jgi:hypothetical protein
MHGRVGDGAYPVSEGTNAAEAARGLQMSVSNEALVLDLLEWINAAPRRYEDVMSAWRTSCPKLTIWEDAVDAGLVAVRFREVTPTAAGRELLNARRGASGTRSGC